MDFQQNNDCDGSLVGSSIDDLHFLLNFIMGTYLGPDVTFDIPRSSAFQRVAENSPPYTSRDLGPSYVSISLLENLYYYLLRKAEPSLILKPDILHKYLKGGLHFPNLTASEDTRQFTRFFPLNLHGQIWYPESFRVVKGVVLINDPIMSHREEKDLDKFRSLSRLGNFKIDMDEFVPYEHYSHDGNDDGEQNCLDNGKETAITGHRSSDGNAHLSMRSQQKIKRRRDDYESPPVFPEVDPVAKHYNSKRDFQRTCISDGPAIMSLLSIPDAQKCTCEEVVSIVLSGTARKAKSGPPVGVVDVGVSKVAYYFRVALPGVRKDYCMLSFSCDLFMLACDILSSYSMSTSPRCCFVCIFFFSLPPMFKSDSALCPCLCMCKIEMMLFLVAGKFSCEIESAGMVHVRGLTSGGRTIRKPSRVFEMKFQQLCPPGPFTLSFSLPGPVDPRQFAPNFRSDGIFEGVVIKHTKK